MKKSLLLLASCFAFIAGANATVRTVNAGITGYPNPGQYSSVSAAITAANAGDTLMIAGSTPYDVAGLTVSKQLVFIGAGYNPQNVDRLTTIISGAVTLNASSNGSVFMGIVFNSQIITTAALSNITFKRCYLINGFSTNYNVTSLMMTECVVNNQINIYGTFTASNFKNNVFIGDLGAGGYKLQLSGTCSNDTVDHNTFINGKNGSPTGSTYASNSGFMRSTNTIITNNIFYNLPPFSSTILPYCTGNYFNNNICYRSGTTMPTMPQAGNFGSGNINNSDPMFTTIFSSSTNLFLDFNNDNIRPASGSPCLSTSTDGTNIGATGGRYPVYLSTNTVLTGEPPVPSVRAFNITSSTVVAPGTPINVTVRAKKIN